MLNAADKWHRVHQDKIAYGLIALLTLGRVLRTPIRPCPLDFDCNSYIKMTTDLFTTDLPGHHAMRILPSLMAAFLHQIGLSIETSFWILSSTAYILFGFLVFWLLRRYKVQTVIALGFSLLCLAPHYAMRIPLQVVYQACDMFTYPLSLLLIYFSCQQKSRWIFFISLIGICTKQNLFILGELSLLYCLFKNKRCENLAYSILLGILYSGSQFYFQATTTFISLLQPPPDFYSFTHFYWVIKDSKIIELIIPIIPFLIVRFKPIMLFLSQYWHIGLYLSIVVAQPIVGYHLTGNNAPRLALQGVWIIFLVAGIVSRKESKYNNVELLVFMSYCLSIYSNWEINTRIILMCSFGMLQGLLFLRQSHWLLDRRLKVSP